MQPARRAFSAATVFLILGVGLAACGGGPVKLVATDLSSHGIAVSLQAPEGAKIEEAAFSVAAEKALDVRKGDFMVMVEAYATPSADDLAGALDQAKQLDRADSTFGKFLVEEPQGYVYSKTLDGGGESFHFTSIVFLDGKEIHFSDGLSLLSDHKEADIKMMFNAVKQ